MSLDILFVAWNRIQFTKWSWAMMIENTDWSRVSKLVVHDDGSVDGTAEWLAEMVKKAPVETSFTIDPLRSPPAVMNRYVATSEAEWFAKIDNDIILPPGWLEAMTGVLERNPEVDILGMEAGRGNSRHADWDGIYRFEPGSHMGGVGLVRVEALAQRTRMNEHQGRYGWTEWQQEYAQVVRGWINPDLAVVSLDRVPFEPWRSLGERYVEQEWARPWGFYHDRADYWDWWPKAMRR